MNSKEKKLAAEFLNIASEQFSRHVCNDVDDLLFENWTLEERRKFIKEYHEWNGDPEEYDENFLHLPDWAIMSFLAKKLTDIKDDRKDKLNKLSNI
jgi:hypothetical protein